MNRKNVELIINPPTPNLVGDGFKMHHFIPGVPQLNMHRTNPFIVLDYNSLTELAPSDHVRGVGAHPHKGFETVSIVYHGKIAHTDSTGFHGVIGAGEVQWMTAASGILHKEYHEEGFSKSGGKFQMVQLWVNLPSEFKKEPPKYQSVTRDKMSRYLIDKDLGIIEVISGEYNGIKGSASTYTTIHIYNAKLKPGAKANFNFQAEYNTILLVIEGNITVNGEQKVKTDQLLIFENKGEEFEISTDEKSVVLILSGEPIKEPIAAHGPFVMNNREEILEACNEFNMGKFGYLE